MCGIGGILRTDGQPIPEQWLDAIDAHIAWRGPDGCGRFRDRVEIDDANAPGGKRVVEVAFVHRRLSIIDHEGGHQPMVSQRGRDDKEGLVAVAFNGCIYNHRELRKELESAGHRFVTDHSDTEVLIHGWRQWREKLVEHLEGMYAFGIWDRGSASLFLARDLFGEKPLYVQGDLLALEWTTFSSSAGAVMAIARRSHAKLAAPPVDWVQGYLELGYSPDGSIALGSDVQLSTLGPGSTFNLGSTRTSERGRPAGFSGKQKPRQDHLVELLRTAVMRRLEADVPLGCFLSGGVDSSLIACFAQQHLGNLRTFTVRMPDARYDESAHGQRVAKHLGTRHTTMDVQLCPADDLLHLIHTIGLPFADSSILPTYWVSKAAREHVKVALSGDGGDELFLGYERYAAALLLHRHHRWLGALPVNGLHGTHVKSRWNKLARLADMARDYRRIGLAAMESIFTQSEIALLTNHAPVQPHRCDAISGAAEPRASLRDFDIRQYLPNDLLCKVDTASMACGLEVRCPFLDRDLARAALSAPIEQLMPHGQRKGLLRQIARTYLPREIVDRPKMGFAIPIGEWFRDDNLPHKGSGMKTLLLDHLNSAEPFGPIQLNRKAVQRLVDEHMAGGTRGFRRFRGRDHGQRLFTLLTLSIWARNLKFNG